MNVMISIVIPCYNSSSNLKKGYQSLLRQNYNEFEVIYVDDCSTDNTLELLYDIKKTSPINIKIIKNERNYGPGLSRNYGIKNACGTYIMFLDSDDYLEDITLMTIGRILYKDDPDCVIFNFYQDGKKHSSMRSKKKHTTYISQSDAIMYSRGSVCGKLYKKSIIDEFNIEFPNLMRNEDMVFNKLCMANCQKIIYLNKNLYHYEDNLDSLMHNSQLMSESDSIIGFELIEKEYQKRDLIKELSFLYLFEYKYSIVKKKYFQGASEKELKDWVMQNNRYIPDKKDIYNFEFPYNLLLLRIYNGDIKLFILLMKLKNKYKKRREK